MPEGQEITIQTRSDREIELYDLETRFAMAARQRDLLEKYIKERLNPGKHFYRVGEGRKDSLTKEGAELILLAHGLKPRYEWLSGPQAPPSDNTPYQITIKAILESGNGKFGGEGIGSASSYITTKDGKHKPRQNDPGLCHNATTKMASKSAYIAATLNATAASEFFTQDMEDIAQGPDGEDKKPEPPNEKSPYWCAKHKVVWFKKGTMRGYAHPIGETGQWCNMPVPKTETTQAPKEPVDNFVEGEVVQPAPEQVKAETYAPGQHPKTVASLRGDLLEAMKPLTPAQKKIVLAVNGDMDQGRWVHTEYQKAIDKAHELSAEAHGKLG